MKLLLPEIIIGSETGFDPQVDIFRRKEYGERLAKLIQNADDNHVLALDADWGEGKSTFIKMWRGYVENEREHKIITIYFDAFENDYQKDPFLILASEIYNLISDEDEESKTRFREKATNTITSLMRGALKIGVKSISAGAIDGTVVDSAEKELSNLIAGQVDNIIADKFKNAKTDRLAISNFKEYLEHFVKDIGNGTPVVFIIDELDRCKPDFALDLLEQVKHLFSVKGITFLLVTNREQLEEVIKVKYGQGLNATNYLHKFVNIWLKLPREVNEHRDYGVEFLKYAISKMANEKESITNYETINAFKDIIKFYRPSLREIERMLSYFSIIHNISTDTTYHTYYQYTIALVCYLNSCRSLALDSIENSNPEKFIYLAGLKEVDENKYHCLSYIKKIIIFDLSSQEIQLEMINNKEIDFNGRMPQDMIKNISSWIYEIKLD